MRFTIIILLGLFFSFNLQAQFVAAQNEAQIDHVLRHTSFMGGGAAFFDYDNDGDDDLYITSGNDVDHFYENNGDGTFAYKSTEAGFDAYADYYTMGVIAGDVDNDGFKDLFVTTNRKDAQLARNLLFHNNGDGTFSEMWTQASEKDKVFSIGATFLDFDLDGWLDIYVVNYVESVDFLENEDGEIIGFNHDCFENRFYKNLGNGQFTEMAEELGLHDRGCALAVAATDFDMDNDMDIYIANDFGEFIIPNKLFENHSGGDYFQDSSEDWNADIAMYGMGIAIGDIDNDLDLDYYVTNFGKNRLIINKGNTFEDITDACGAGDQWVTQDSTLAIGWGTSFLDVDNDADLDLYVSNGYVPSPNFLPSHIYMNDKLFLNDGNLNFIDTETSYGISNQYTSRGMSHSDYDNDGDLDILSVVLNVPIGQGGWQTVLYKNNSQNQNNWVQVTLEGVETHRDAYGSKVFIYADNQTFMQELTGGSSHCSQLSSKLHFGLKDIQTVDSLQVIWTGGIRTQMVYDVPVNELIHVEEDTSIPAVVTSVFDIKGSHHIDVFPNPSDDFIYIELQDNTSFDAGEVQVYNAFGQLEIVSTIDNGETVLKLDVNQMTAGIHYIFIKTKEISVAKKVLIQHK